MTPEDQKKISKRLSLHLRHEPETLGIALDDAGWTEVDTLLDAFSRRYFPLTREALDEVVRDNEKQRFAFDETGRRIRASQGHSVEIDLQLEPIEPPEFLYHGTGEKSVAAILREGLRRMDRHHVHLSPDTETARRVGQRHGKPAVFRVRAAAMRASTGAVFFRSANGVWLVDAVAPEWLELTTS
jgi:putative RNA 2'-phosphotransferase